MTYALQKIYMASLKKKYQFFCKNLSSPQNTQEQILKQTLANNQGSQFGCKYQFKNIADVKAYQKTVPLRSYDNFKTHIEKLKSGQLDELTQEKVVLFEKTSGSTDSAKYIPMTQSFFKDIQMATAPWLYQLYKKNPSLLSSRSYWSISPNFSTVESYAGIPVGLQDDSNYLGFAGKVLSRFVFATPTTISQIESFKEWERQTCYHLLKAKNLGFVSVWSPTFLDNLLNKIHELWSDLAPLLKKQRRKEIERALSSKNPWPIIWPKLKIISCWADGESTDYYQQLKRRLPDFQFEQKGLAATEGIVSFPFNSNKILAYTSHFFEFLDLNKNIETQTPLLAHELKKGGDYSLVLTTSAGLYRYHLKDVITCDGFLHNTPLISYKGKLDKVSDMAGEKLNSQFVSDCLRKAHEETQLKYKFALIAPTKEPQPEYHLYLESDDNETTKQEFRNATENYLKQNPHYDLCLKLGQLNTLKVIHVTEGFQKYQQLKLQQGIKLGDIKPTSFETQALRL